MSQVGIGTSTVSSSAILEIQSESKGILLPRLTTTQRNSISSPSLGLMIFNTTDGIFQGYADSRILHQENTSYSGDYYDYSVWQSFSPTVSGKLETITFNCPGYPNGISASNFTCRIYSGTGTAGTLLETKITSFLQGTTSIDLSALNIQLTSGNTYTFQIDTGFNTGQLWPFCSFSSGNRYSGGRSSWDVNRDILFALYMRYPRWVDLH
jgi:hypothetical protein